MAFSIIIGVATCALLIACVLFFPRIKIGKFEAETYWLVALLGALILLFSGQMPIKEVLSALVADSAINPIKILVLFISMTVLSVFLDELGFFSYLANVTLKRAKTSQIKLFMYLYITVSILTVFTSNDVIILSFTPFICYFAKNAKISPIPYLAAEFIAANTWSMALIIGNPTNIYLGSAYGIDFLSYVKVMGLPTLAAGLVAFGVLFLMFFRKLKEPISGEAEEVYVKDKPLLIVGIAHLAVCTVLLAIGSYINVEMWLVSLCSLISLCLFVLIISLVRKHKPTELVACAKRAPWQLIPFVLSMFIIILVLSHKGVTAALTELLGTGGTVFRYGITSFLSANLINNIPMSVLFCSIIEPLSGAVQTQAVFATVIGSNLGAFLTPIGALAGIMWQNILRHHGIKFGYVDFLKIGTAVAIPTLMAALTVLHFIL